MQPKIDYYIPRVDEAKDKLYSRIAIAVFTIGMAIVVGWIWSFDQTVDTVEFPVYNPASKEIIVGC